MKKCKKCLVCETKTKQKFMKFLKLDVIPNVPGGGWVSLGVWAEEGLLSKSEEVTLQESTAANPEYGDFLCASRLAAAGFSWVFFSF